MKDGFITALGTPLDTNGDLVVESFQAHIADQIDAGASALLVVGTMGNEAYIRNSVYPQVARVAVDQIGHRVPTMIGVMDNSISRVLDRIQSLSELKIDGVVATTPFYLPCSQLEIVEHFTRIAAESPFPLYLYDLPPVTQTKIEPATALELMKIHNLHGIKSGDLLTCKILHTSDERPEDFSVMFSGLDLFDVAFTFGIRYNLDGMFACTHPIAERMYNALRSGDGRAGTRALEQITGLRNCFMSVGVLKGFTVAMNLLGYDGHFAPDYVVPATDAERETVAAYMKNIGLL